MKQTVKRNVLIQSICCLISISLFCGAVEAQVPGMQPQKSWDMNGYLKYMISSTMPDHNSDTINHLIHQRLNFEYRFNSNLRFNAGLRNRFFAGDIAEQRGYGKQIDTDYGFRDLSTNWINNNGAIGNSQLDRLYIHWKNDNWELSGGRFRINWSMNSLWNPNDLFNSYSIYDFDYEEHPGSDALMVSRKLGFASQLDLVINPDKDSDLNSVASRYLFNRNGWDIQFLLGKSGLDHTLGAGFAGEVKGAGIRGEFSWFDPSEETWNGKPQESSSVSSLEIDYSFAGQYNWTTRAAILHISNPQKPERISIWFNRQLSPRTLSFTHFTGYIDAGFDLSPLTRLTLTTTYYQDGSFFIRTNGTHSLSDNWQLLTVLQRLDGDSNSLFGQAPSTSAYLQIKWSY